MKQLVAFLLLSGLLGGQSQYQPFLDSDKPPIGAPGRLRFALSLGTGWWQAKADDNIAIQNLINPLTGLPFDKTTDAIVAFGTPSLRYLPVEGARAGLDHLGLPILTNSKAIQGKYIDFLLCHSDGCSTTLMALQRGEVHAEYVIALGSNWTSKTHENYGAKVIFFAVDGDKVPLLPAPVLARAGDALTVGGVIRFGGQPGEYPVVHLPLPIAGLWTRDKKRGLHFEKSSPHAISVQLFALRQWLRGGSEHSGLATELKHAVESRRVSTCLRHLEA